MFLYELAIQLDRRSTELASAAEQLGMQGLGPTSKLTDQQVAALRAHLAPTSFAPPAPGVVGPSGLAGAPAGPASWGPPPGAAAPPPPPGAAAPPPPAGPPTWGPPTGAPAGPPPDAGAAGGVASWGPPPPPPGAVPPAVTPAAPPPADPSASPAEPGAWPPPAGTGPTPLSDTPWLAPGSLPPGVDVPHGGDGFSRGQLAVLGVVIVAVVALFGYMATNSAAKDQPTASASAADDEEADATVVPQLSDEERLNRAKLENARAENEERACNALRAIGHLDAEVSNSLRIMTSLEEVKAGYAAGVDRLAQKYDEAIAVIPEQAENMRRLKQYLLDSVSTVQAASTPRQLMERANELERQAIESGVSQAGGELAMYAQDTCGISIN